MKQLTTYMILFTVYFFGLVFYHRLYTRSSLGLSRIAIYRLLVIVLFLTCISWQSIVHVSVTRKDILLLFAAGILGVAINHYSFYASLRHQRRLQQRLS
ncbi:EamA family transporter OS=Lysinibacillus sphaericus OX=1421 GN=LS41612_06025 PE=3 SV=1 [Lysinibacillus sphaericus]